MGQGRNVLEATKPRNSERRNEGVKADDERHSRRSLLLGIVACNLVREYAKYNWQGGFEKILWLGYALPFFFWLRKTVISLQNL